MSIRRCQTLLSLLLMLLLGPVLTGCGGYALQGRVVESQTPVMDYVDSDDRRLDGEPISEALIRVHRDPGSLSRQLIATGRSAPDGTFSIPIRSFGAGWMDEEWLIEVHRVGYGTAQRVLRLPRSDSTPLLIQLAPGPSTPLEDFDDFDSELEQYR